MIEKMKVVHIVAAQTQKTELLDALRALGIVHFADKVDADQGYLERFAALSRLITVLEAEFGEGGSRTLDEVEVEARGALMTGSTPVWSARHWRPSAPRRGQRMRYARRLGQLPPFEIKELKAGASSCTSARDLTSPRSRRTRKCASSGSPRENQQTVAILGALARCAARRVHPCRKST